MPADVRNYLAWAEDALNRTDSATMSALAHLEQGNQTALQADIHALSLVGSEMFYYAGSHTIPTQTRSLHDLVASIGSRLYSEQKLITAYAAGTLASDLSRVRTDIGTARAMIAQIRASYP
jgi:hypothetical protein